MRLAVHGSTLPSLFVDQLQVPQAARSLLDNAIDHSPRYSTIIIETSFRQRDTERRVRCTVRDSGNGVDPADLRTSSTRSSVAVHAVRGSGLAIVERIVDGHGASISANDHAAGGFEVTIDFPCSPPAG